MTRRAVLKSFGVAPALLRAQSRSRLNLLLLMADQHRADCLGADGNRVIHTPNLDRIAGEGVRFRYGYSSTPTCTPARAGLLSGLSPWNHGMLGYGRVAARYAVEMPQSLRDAGYYTFGIGKMHWHPQRSLHGFHATLLDESGRAESPDFRSDYRAWFASEAPNLDPDATGIGWNDYRAAEYKLPERLHPTHWTAGCASRFIQSYDHPEPFFLKVSFARPHSPYDPPSRWMKYYDGAALPAPAIGAWASRYQQRSDASNNLWHGRLGADAVRHSRQGYYGSASFVDEQIGRVLDALEARKLMDETLILYISDHGDMTGDHNLWRKSYAYEASARIPFLMRGPGVPRGAVSDVPVEIRDVLATFLAAAGAEPPSKLDGQDLRAVKREWIDLEHDVCYAPSNHWNALTDGRTKYIYHAQHGEEQLFDLAADPHELNDLAGAPAGAALLGAWRSRMTEFLAPRGQEWVRGGRLVPRPRSHLYSPNYPASPQ